MLVAGTALALAGAARLATEPFRPALGSRPVVWYLAAIVAGAALVVTAIRGRVGGRS
jgi:hypothetical protein